MIGQSLLGLVAFLSIAWLLSENRRRVDLRLVAVGLLLTIATALVLVKVPISREGFILLNRLVLALQQATLAGTSFVFGYLGGGPLPFAETYPGSSFILAFQALPMVLVMSALSALLFYWRVLPAVVKGFSWGLRKTMRVGGAEGLSNAVNVFVGMVEAPLVVKPYLARLSRSELFMVMVCGMATIAGTVMAIYGAILKIYREGKLYAQKASRNTGQGYNYVSEADFLARSRPWERYTTDYRALVELARQKDGSPLQSREIAVRQGIPQAYLDQLLVSLRRGGLVKSVRGAGGGYLLAKSPDGLTVADCLRPLSSDLFSNRWQAPAGSDSAVTTVFHDALSAAVGVLRGMTLAELVDAQDARSAAQTYMMHI